MITAMLRWILWEPTSLCSVDNDNKPAGLLDFVVPGSINRPFRFDLGGIRFRTPGPFPAVVPLDVPRLLLLPHVVGATTLLLSTPLAVFFTLPVVLFRTIPEPPPKSRWS